MSSAPSSSVAPVSNKPPDANTTEATAGSQASEPAMEPESELDANSHTSLMDDSHPLNPVEDGTMFSSVRERDALRVRAFFHPENVSTPPDEEGLVLNTAWPAHKALTYYLNLGRLPPPSKVAAFMKVFREKNPGRTFDKLPHKLHTQMERVRETLAENALRNGHELLRNKHREKFVQENATELANPGFCMSVFRKGVSTVGLLNESTKRLDLVHNSSMQLQTHYIELDTILKDIRTLISENKDGEALALFKSRIFPYLDSTSLLEGLIAIRRIADYQRYLPCVQDHRSFFLGNEADEASHHEHVDSDFMTPDYSIVKTLQYNLACEPGSLLDVDRHVATDEEARLRYGLWLGENSAYALLPRQLLTRLDDPDTFEELEFKKLRLIAVSEEFFEKLDLNETIAVNISDHIQGSRCSLTHATEPLTIQSTMEMALKMYWDRVAANNPILQELRRVCPSTELPDVTRSLEYWNLKFCKQQQELLPVSCGMQLYENLQLGTSNIPYETLHYLKWARAYREPTILDFSEDGPAGTWLEKETISEAERGMRDCIPGSLSGESQHRVDATDIWKDSVDLEELDQLDEETQKPKLFETIFKEKRARRGELLKAMVKEDGMRLVGEIRSIEEKPEHARSHIDEARLAVLKPALSLNRLYYERWILLGHVLKGRTVEDFEKYCVGLTRNLLLSNWYLAYAALVDITNEQSVSDISRLTGDEVAAKLGQEADDLARKKDEVIAAKNAFGEFKVNPKVDWEHPELTFYARHAFDGNIAFARWLAEHNPVIRSIVKRWDEGFTYTLEKPVYCYRPMTDEELRHAHVEWKELKSEFGLAPVRETVETEEQRGAISPENPPTTASTWHQQVLQVRDAVKAYQDNPNQKPQLLSDLEDSTAEWAKEYEEQRNKHPVTLANFKAMREAGLVWHKKDFVEPGSVKLVGTLEEFVFDNMKSTKQDNSSSRKRSLSPGSRDEDHPGSKRHETCELDNWEALRFEY
ncbi:uncharacterized protein E0L32_008284 [Thyridium curvatum]|uniref:Uncharacterized protein n=1 Tax=Thyridium curvatum TaxID=1093900 RepID=A0A507AK04_9PEZI|nr:uncharacterized protein E0L32_008284 [Thyridium curvatum]TPX10715.1 hypothetical protein E0L32_008284 [Thyridium curvatum]